MGLGLGVEIARSSGFGIRLQRLGILWAILLRALFPRGDPMFRLGFLSTSSWDAEGHGFRDGRLKVFPPCCRFLQGFEDAMTFPNAY